MNAKIILTTAALAVSCLAFAQDTTRVPVVEGDPAVRQSLQTIFADEDMPRNVRFGDGSQIDDEIVDHIRSLYREASISFA